MGLSPATLCYATGDRACLPPKILRHRRWNRTAQQTILVHACDTEVPAQSMRAQSVHWNGLPPPRPYIFLRPSLPRVWATDSGPGRHNSRFSSAPATQRSPFKARALKARVGMGFPTPSEAVHFSEAPLSQESAPQTAHTPIVVSAVRPERPAKRAAGGLLWLAIKTPRKARQHAALLTNGWALCPAWFPKISPTAQHVIYVAVRAPARP